MAQKEADTKRFSFKFQNRPNFGKSSNEQPNSEISKQPIGSDTNTIFPKPYQSSEKRRCFICDSTEYLIARCPFKVKETQKEVGSKQASGQASSLLYSPTKQDGNGKKLQIPATVELNSDEVNLDNGLQFVKGCLNGKSVLVLRDTGAATIFVSDRIISKEQIGMNKKEVTLANWDTQFCPEVKVCIESPYISGIVDALFLSSFTDNSLKKSITLPTSSPLSISLEIHSEVFSVDSTFYIRDLSQ